MKLKKFQVNHGGKFNPDGTGPVVIDFTKSNMVALEADQEAGKTTILELFLMACGQMGGADAVAALKNKDTDKIDVDFSFTGNDRAAYDVNVSKSRIQVKRDGEMQGSPKDLLKKMLGVVGVSPMEIKNKDIDDIVKWLATYSTRGVEEFVKGMEKLKLGIKASRKTRADANRSVKGLRQYLTDEGYLDDKYQVIEKTWTASETRFKIKPDVKKISAELEEAGKKSDAYIKYEATHKAAVGNTAGMELAIDTLEKEIAEMQRQLEEKKTALEKHNQSIVKGELWLKENKKVKTDYDEVKGRYDTVSLDVVAYNKWLDVKNKKSELDGYEDISQRADAKEKDLIKEQQELQWEVIPDIKGVDIVLEDSHEDEGEQIKAGFYYKGLNSRQLSESEWFGLVLQIWKKNKVRVVVIDNVSTLGSKFMEILEKLVNDGCYVLMAEMKRGQTELEIDYK